MICSQVALLEVGILHASPIGNLAAPSLLEEGFWIPDCSWSGIRAGVSGDILFHKRLTASHASRVRGVRGSEISGSSSWCDIIWNIRERWDVCVMAGYAHPTDLQFLLNDAAYEALGNRGTVWGGSSTFVLLEKKDTSLGVNIHAGGTSRIRGPFLQNGRPFAKDFSSHVYFWQFAAGLSQRIGVFTPYFGAVLQKFFCLVRANGFERVRFHVLCPVGLYEGCSMTLGSRVSLHLEARQFFESGLMLSGEVRL